MTLDTLASLLSPFDALALGVMALGWYLLGWRIEKADAKTPSVTILMADYRREWLVHFVTRQPRIYDASVISSLRQSTNWLASTTLLALGGLLALIGNPDPLRGVAQDLVLDAPSERAFEMRLLLAALFLSHGFLKFLWSNRLFGYASIMMSTVPNDPEDPLAYPRARQAAEINIRAAFNFNRGLRATYFALASLAWLFGPWTLLASTAFVIWLIWSREYASHSRAVLLDPPPGTRAE
ncbi:DUF599 domain-containing protein [Pararhodobacter marinus]|uniref:DUF599 domain-containing protein n=2 Tax=Pararhodobacter marinus TaxID=2184063 RepID=A0A2U2C6E1_9RHOB|nr:DUF599 domain-containing protein [Pararhodobacter marinus]PWE27419.1 DUF599 domain-containing protein [Pararhodobacter marinus]